MNHKEEIRRINRWIRRICCIGFIVSAAMTYGVVVFSLLSIGKLSWVAWLTIWPGCILVMVSTTISLLGKWCQAVIDEIEDR